MSSTSITSDSSSTLTQSNSGGSVAGHFKTLIAVLAVIAAVLAAVTFFMSKSDQKAEEGRSALFKADQALAQAMKPLEAAQAPATPPAAKGKGKEAPPAEPVSMEYAKLDVDAKLGPAVEQYKAVADKFAKTRPGFEAELKLGNLYLNHGEPAKAVTWFEKAVSHAPNSFEKATSYAAWGYALENAGKTQDAIQAFEKAINQGESSIKGEMLLGVARGYEKLNDLPKARSTYDQIISQLPNTDASRIAEANKGQLE